MAIEKNAKPPRVRNLRGRAIQGKSATNGKSVLFHDERSELDRTLAFHLSRAAFILRDKNENLMHSW
jgi:hypothetical protein